MYSTSGWQGSGWHLALTVMAFNLALALFPVFAVAQTASAIGGWQTTEVASSCERSDFEATVDGAAETLRDLTGRNTPLFQAKLRELKAKRGWSHEEFLREAERFVRDEKIAAFDAKSVTLLAELDAAGNAEISSKGKPDCNVLHRLRTVMATLVETQEEKWAYMFTQVEAALAK